MSDTSPMSGQDPTPAEKPGLDGTGHDRTAPPAIGYPAAPPAPAPLSPQDERTWGMLSHVSALIAGVLGLSFAGPLIVYLIYKDRSPFVRHHAAESLNFQISLWIYAAVGVILSIVTLGLGLFIFLPVAFVAGIVALVLIIMASVAAYDGRGYRYPLTIRMVN